MTRATICSIILAAVLMAGCSGEDRIAAALDGTKELSDGDAVPFLLSQNYPNPFNPTTTIELRVGQTMFISVRVYSEDWTPAGVVIEQSFVPGIFRMTFDASSRPSGIYYLVAEGGGFRQIRTMRLIK